MIGQTISHYKILEKLGEGGMGVVYKAQDTKLDRFVALKFLPPHLAASEQDKARFIQEAKSASALNHPNVCTIHDIQEFDGQIFIVMEFVDGQTLQEKKSTLTLKQAIEYGIQIADGLAAAHEKGIVHRDIKPENIMIRKDGIVQVMDFGLAKLAGVSRLTKAGSTVGTLGYMSPEQVQGQESDHRSDIFSFGVLLYEMIAGRSPFNGAHESAILYEIVNVDVQPMSSFKPELDPSLDAIVLECLEKEPSERYQSVAEVGKELRRFKRESSRSRASRTISVRNIAQSSSMGSSAVDDQNTVRKFFTNERIVWSIVVLVLIVLNFLRLTQSPLESNIYRVSIVPPEKAIIVSWGGGNIEIAPDGKSMTFSAKDSLGVTRLWVRVLNSLTALPLNGTEGATYPFWSPDSRYIGFFANGKMKKVEASGGPPQIICDASNGRGGTWNKEGVIVFSPTTVQPLYRVSADGGTPVLLTKFDTERFENSHRWPQFLPDGKHFIYFIRASNVGRNDPEGIYVSSLDTNEKSTFIVKTSSNASYASGMMLFIREKTLMTQPFDLDRLQLTGDVSPVAQQVQFDPSFNKAIFSVSQNGNLLYKKGASQGVTQLLWYDRRGTMLGMAGKQGDFISLRLSPDASRVAISLYDAASRNFDIWLYNLHRDLWTRLTFDPAIDGNPVWSPDGSQFVFSSTRKGRNDIFKKASTGAMNEETLLESASDKNPQDWSRDGKYLAYTSIDLNKRNDLWILPLSGNGQSREPIPFLQTAFNEGTGASFSPDGKWIAYTSDESGESQIYVRPFPGPGGKWQISTDGGIRPKWRKDGKELFYLAHGNKMMAVDIRSNGSAFEVGGIRFLFDFNAYGGSGNSYDVTADGQRFLVNTNVEETEASPITLVLNWNDEVKKK